MFAVLTLVPAAPAATEPCTCALNWTDPDSGHACSEPQSGCPPVACDGPYPPWCVVESLPCADPDPDSGINTGLYGGNWIHCEPEYSPTPPSYPPPPPFAVVRIGALLPRQLPSGELMHLGRAEDLTSVLMAIQEINNKTDGVADDLLPNTQLLLSYRDSRCDPDFGFDAAYELLRRAFGGAGVHALIGAFCSSASISAARLSALADTPQVSHASTSPDLSGDDFPFFARVISSDSLLSVGLAETTRNLLGIKRVATIACTDAYCTAGMAAFEAAASAQGITVLESVRFENGQSNFGEPLAALHASRATVFVAIVHSQDAARLLEQALDLRLVGPKYTWVGEYGMFEAARVLGDHGVLEPFRGMLAITNSIAPSVAYDGYASRKRARPSTLGDGTNCDPAEDDEGHKLWSVDTDENAMAPRCFGANNQFPESVYASRAYDAVYAVAHAVQALVDDPLVQRIDGDALMAALLAVRFDGVTGKVSFSSEPATLGDRAGGVLYDVMNVNASGAWVKLGTWQPADNWEQSFAGNGQALTRPTPDNSKPPELAGDTLRVGVFCDISPWFIVYEKCQHVMHIIDRINDKKDGFLDDLLPDHTLFYSMVQTGTTGCAESEAIRRQFDQLYSDLNGVVATIGPFCSDDVAAVTAAEWRAGADISTVVLSPSSTAPILANVGAYPNLLRLSSNDKHV
uniref:Receptor ligand binding region domain-containing protein n=2 Tax=Emiliania huxleyi TaxID=2903 RepID=A0A0D3KB68_EMIH1